MKQTEQKPAQPASLDALVEKNPEHLYGAVKMIAEGESMYWHNPLAGLAAMYVGMRLIPKGTVPELEKHLKLYETLFMNAMNNQAKTCGAATQGAKFDYTPGKTANAAYKG